MIDAHTRFWPASKVKLYFEKISKKLGANFLLYESLIDWFGFD
jgi:hypothetical protein